MNQDYHSVKLPPSFAGTVNSVCAMEEARKTKHAREETPWSNYYKNVVKGTLHNNLPNTTFLKKKVESIDKWVIRPQV